MKVCVRYSRLLRLARSLPMLIFPKSNASTLRYTSAFIGMDHHEFAVSADGRGGSGSGGELESFPVLNGLERDREVTAFLLQFGDFKRAVLIVPDRDVL